MKTHLAAAAAALVVCALASLPADASVQFATTGSTVRLYDNAGGNGGIFEVDVASVTSTAVPHYYGSVTHYDFQTFCVEISEHISFGTPYTVTSANNTVTVTSGKTLGGLAAWVYTQFLKPTLGAGPGLTAIAGYGGDLSQDANSIQYAIWKSMGWVSGVTDTNLSLAAHLATLATGSSGRFSGQLGAYDPVFLYNLLDLYSKDTTWDPDAPGSVAGLGANWNYTETINPVTYGNVRIMNLAVLNPDGSPKSYHQDQLVWSPPPGGGPPEVPEPVSFLVWSMLATCVGTLGLRSRVD